MLAIRLSIRTKVKIERPALSGANTVRIIDISGVLSFLNKTVAIHTLDRYTAGPDSNCRDWNRSPCIEFLRATNYERHNQDALFALTKAPFALFSF